MISGIVLAAGSAERIGRQKLLLHLKGKPVLQWTLEAALASKLDEVICVTRALNEMEKQISLGHEKLRWVANEKAHEGQSTSIIAGLKAVSPQSEAAVFVVGDQPLVKPELINGLIRLFRKSKALIVAPIFQDQTRNPVIFHRNLFPEILKLKGDRGARGLIGKYRQDSAFLEWPDEAPFVDIDVWEDYEKLQKSASHSA